MSSPPIRYARNGDVYLAYTVTGDGPRELLFVPGWMSHLDLMWEWPTYRRFLDRLQSFCRLIVMDRRGAGLSDRTVELLTVEQQVDDVLAVLDDAGVERASMFGSHDGAATLSFLAATHPSRVETLVMYGARARFLTAPDFPLGMPADRLQSYIATLTSRWGDESPDTPLREQLMPSLVADPAECRWWARFNRSSASPGVVRKVLEMYAEIDLRDVLPSIHAPTLLLAREGDQLTVAANSEIVASFVPDSTVAVLPGRDTFFPVGDMGAIADEIEEFVTGSRHLDIDDRVLATVLCTDMVGSTQRLASVGDRRWKELLDEHDRVADRTIARYRGRKVASTGDGLLATFDGPARAIRCAQELALEASRLGVDLRSGVHTGEVEIRGDDIAGITVHVAVRIQAAAEPGDVLVSRTVADLVTGSGICFDDRGDHELKGVPGSWRLLAAQR